MNGRSQHIPPRKPDRQTEARLIVWSFIAMTVVGIVVLIVLGTILLSGAMP